MIAPCWQMLTTRRKRRKSAFVGLSFVFALLIFGYLAGGSRYQRPSLLSHTDTKDTTVDEFVRRQAGFWRSLYEIILNNDPKCEKPPEIVVPTQLDVAYQDDHIHNRPDVLWVDEADIERLKVAHTNFLSDLRSSSLRLVYNKGTRGIISTVSDAQFPVLLIQLRMLRLANSTLPVEIFLNRPSLSSNHLCTNVVPEFNARCVFLDDIFQAASTGVALTSYQHKIMSVIFSSFEEILLLDADAWPIHSPDPLFESEPFVTTGLVLWPDFWYASESPYFFNVAKVDEPPPLYLRPSTESGELMYNKSKHESSIMLASYYNYYGPQYYYPLQSQGAPGQGDKETFGLAALVLNEDFYAVRTMVTALGRGDSTGEFVGSAMLQYDPSVDLQNHPWNMDSTTTKDGHERTSGSTTQQNHHPMQTPPSQVEVGGNHNQPSVLASFRPKSRPLFVHANFPKFDPRTIFTGDKPPTRDTNGTHVRCWSLAPDLGSDSNNDNDEGPLSATQVAEQRFGYDVERRFWGAIHEVACHDIVTNTNKESGKKEADVCNQVESYIDEIFPDLLAKSSKTRRR